MKFSAIEIYNEAIRDLLSSDGASLRLRDDPVVQNFNISLLNRTLLALSESLSFSYQKGTVVEKATEETLRDWNHLKDLLSVCEGKIPKAMI